MYDSMEPLRCQDHPGHRVRIQLRKQQHKLLLRHVWGWVRVNAAAFVKLGKNPFAFLFGGLIEAAREFRSLPFDIAFSIFLNVFLLFCAFVPVFLAILVIVLHGFI